MFTEWPKPVHMLKTPASLALALRGHQSLVPEQADESDGDVLYFEWNTAGALIG